MPSRALHLAALGAFFFSGFAAMVYQVVWQRLLVAFSGACGDVARTCAHTTRRAGINAEDLMSSYLVDPARYTPDFDRDTLSDFNTDLFPRDEYDLSPLPR